MIGAEQSNLHGKMVIFMDNDIREQHALHDVDLGSFYPENKSCHEKLGDRAYFARLQKDAERRGRKITCLWDGSETSPTFEEMAMSMGLASELQQSPMRKQGCIAGDVDNDEKLQKQHTGRPTRMKQNKVSSQPGVESHAESTTISEERKPKQLLEQSMHNGFVSPDAANIFSSPTLEDLKSSPLECPARVEELRSAKGNSLTPRADKKRASENTLSKDTGYEKKLRENPKQAEWASRLKKNIRTSTRFRPTPRAANLKLTQTTLNCFK